MTQQRQTRQPSSKPAKRAQGKKKLQSTDPVSATEPVSVPVTELVAELATEPVSVPVTELVAELVAELATEPVSEPVSGVTEITAKKSRKRVDVGYVNTQINDFMSELETELLSIVNTKEVPSNRQLKSLVKKGQKLQTDVSKVLSKPLKRRQNVDASTSHQRSGFLKPAHITKELAEFAAFDGWVQDDLKSRTDVTTMLHKYIVQHGLQEPTYRRKINPDAKLQKLLGYNPSVDGDLLYHTMQKFITQHIVK